MVRSCMVAAVLLAVVALVVTSVSGEAREDKRMLETYNWLTRNYRELLDRQPANLATKRGELWQFKNRRCNPLYDWNCNNAWGRIGRRR